MNIRLSVVGHAREDTEEVAYTLRSPIAWGIVPKLTNSQVDEFQS